MSDWTINPWNIPMALAIGVFVLLIAYVSSIKSKSRSTKTLLAWLVVVTIHVAAITLENIAANSGWTDAFWNEWLLDMIMGFAAPLGQVLWVWFAYLFGTILFKTEQRRVMAFLLPLAIVLGVIEVFEPFGDWNELTAPIVFLTQLWGVVVLARKWWISRRLDRTVYSSGYLVFPAVFSIPLFAVPVQYLMELGGVVGVTIWWTSFFTLALPIFIGLLFLQYTPESSSLEAKYFAVAVLVIVIAVQVRVGAITLLSDSWQRYAEPPFTQSYVFSPDGASGYTARSIPARFYDAVGEVLDAADDTTIVRAAPFSVSIYGATSDSIFINSNGAISLALPTPLDSLGGTTQLHRMDVPSVGAFRVDMDPSEAGQWVYTSTPDSLVVTWRDVPLFWDESENGRWPVEKRLFNSQIVMRRDGTIVLNRGELGVRPNNWETGMTAGLIDQLPSYMQDSSWRGKVGTISEGYLWPITISEGEMAWVAESNSLKRIRFSQAESKQILRFMGFMFLSILVLVPIYFRISIRSRLRNLMTGLDNVVSGNMDVQVPVNVRDEVGQMSDAFNSMTASLRTYSHEMEDLVEERTAELKATQAQLVEQEKLASLGSLTAGIAHEIKNPLNFVNNFAEVGAELADELAEAIAAGNSEEATSILAELKANAQQITKHGRRADSIVKSMMQHARGGASDMESVDVNVFLEEYANLAWHGIRAKDHTFQADVIRDYDPDAGSLGVMPQELGRVVLNLLNNAFDAVKETENARVTVASRRTADGVTISVSDNGPGIPEAIRQKIFEPFFTTKATGEGTGLGLSLSHDIVTKGHGGTMTVGTSTEDGAEFTITLPANA